MKLRWLQIRHDVPTLQYYDEELEYWLDIPVLQVSEETYQESPNINTDPDWP